MVKETTKRNHRGVRDPVKQREQPDLVYVFNLGGLK